MNDSPWRPEEFSLPVYCPVCNKQSLRRMTEAPILDPEDNQSSGALFSCESCQHRCWIYLRWAGTTVVLIANTP